MFEKRVDFKQSIDELIPVPENLARQIEQVLELARENLRNGSLEELHSFNEWAGEAAFSGVLRRLSPEEKVEILQATLPLAGQMHTFAHVLVDKLVENSTNLLVLNNLVQQVQADNFLAPKTPGGRSWFGETVALAQLGLELRGAEFLMSQEALARDPWEAMQNVKEILEHNAAVLGEQAGDQLRAHPFAINAELLLSSFHEQSANFSFQEEHNGQSIFDFVQGWQERIIVHTETGLGVFDNGELTLTADQLSKIREAVLSIPPTLTLFQGNLLRIDYTTAPAGSEDALGAFHMGRVMLFPAMSHAIPGLNAPVGVDPVKYAVMHELGHGMHTHCMEEFKRLSGWVEIVNWQFLDIKTGDYTTLAPDDFIAGNEVEIRGQKYTVSDYKMDRTKEFGFGEQAIRFKNPYNVNGSGYLRHNEAQFVNEYAATSPIEDYAESFAMYFSNPEDLQKLAPEKYEFMHYLYGPATRSA